jgi:hypothetical protein
MLARILLRTAVGAVLFAAAAANAQIFRAYLASDGSDASPCTLAQPCRLLPAALTAVASGGEIWMLDSANYNTGTVTIGKSVTILAVPGVVGSVVALNGGSAISIGAADLKIVLRNLVIGPVAGATPGNSGIVMNGASRLTVENSVIANLPLFGIFVQNAGTLRVVDTILRNNGGHAIWLENGARGMISGSRILDNAYGVLAQCSIASVNTLAVISDSVISGNTEGVLAYSYAAGSTSRVSVARSTIERADSALYSIATNGGFSEVNVSASQIVDNVNAWNQQGGGSATILSTGDNLMSGNTSSVGTKTALPGG